MINECVSSSVQLSILQVSAVQCSAVQCSAVQCSAMSRILFKNEKRNLISTINYRYILFCLLYKHNRPLLTRKVSSTLFFPLTKRAGWVRLAHLGSQS